MKFKSRAPFRIGLAGGGTDVSPYCDRFGGAVLNAAVNLYATVTIEPVPDSNLIFINQHGNQIEVPVSNQLQIDPGFDLVIAVYNRLQKEFAPELTGFRLQVEMDVPGGSGLGTSSTLVVAAITAFTRMWQIEMDKHSLASLAYDIERIDLQLAGGRQDQYAAAFGGINFLEIENSGTVNVQPLHLNKESITKLEDSLLLFYSDSSRNSSDIIKAQQENVLQNVTDSIEAMHALKKQALALKESLEAGKVDETGPLLDFGFREKVKMAKGIQTDSTQLIYEAAMSAGATGGKISGAGGGGFMIFYCPDNAKINVAQALQQVSGSVQPFQFDWEGAKSWAYPE